jgi:hypothetical protein
LTEVSANNNRVWFNSRSAWDQTYDLIIKLTYCLNCVEEN